MNKAVEPEAHSIEAARPLGVEQSIFAAHPHVPAQPQPPAHPVHAMQRSLGNRATRRILTGGILQPKLTIGAPDDVYEKEADAVAEQVIARTSLTAAGASGSDDDNRDHHGLARKATDRESVRRDILRRIPIRTLQQALGNRALARLLKETRPVVPAVPGLSRKCACGGDAKEKCAECSQKELALQRRPASEDGAGEAPPIVEDVLNTAGQPLADSARRTLEPGFGHDFSGVRVHDDSKAAESASAVSAHAYTVGNHIVFGSSKYAPGTADGNRLLAHELTHVIQQSGDTARREKSALEPPGAQTERRDLSIQPRIQRYSEKISVTGMGSGAGASTVTVDSVWGSVDSPSGFSKYLEFKSATTETVTLPEDVVAGRVEFHLFEMADINNLLLDDHQFGKWTGTVPFSVNGDQVTFGAPIPTQDQGGQGATLSVNVGGSANNGGGIVTFSATVSSSGSQTTGGGVGVGPISASAPVQGTSNFAGGMTRSFTVNLRLTPPKPIQAPDVSFKIGKDELTDGQDRAIGDWFDGLSPSVLGSIRNGRRSVIISGYASTTGRPGSNRDLSERRAHVVERILRGHAGSAASIDTFYFGQDTAGHSTPAQTEDPQFRRATIVVQVPSLAAPGGPGPASGK